MESETSQIIINQYINNELSGDALSKFEAQLQKDKALQEKVNFHKEVDAILYEKMAPVKTFEEEEAALKPLLNEFGNQYFLQDEKDEIKEKELDITKPVDETKPKPKLVRRILPFISFAAAAAVLLFVIAPWKSNLSGKQLADNNFENFPIEKVRSSTDNTTIISNAQKAYFKKDYQAAIAGFNEYLNQNPNAPNIWLSKGSAQYQLNLLDEALVSFEKANNLNPDFKAIAHWYLALTYLKKEDTQKAKTALTQILKGEEKYEEAQSLLQQIEKIPVK